MPLSFRSLVEALAIELASCDRRPVYCLDGDVEMRHSCNGCRGDGEFSALLINKEI